MDDDVVEIENVEDVCRLCLSIDEPRSSVFAAQEQEDSSCVTLVAKIQACLSIQISTSDKLSTLICANCVKNVNKWHTYKESCLRSQDKLQEWLSKQLQQNPTVIMVKDEPMDINYEDNIEIISETTNNPQQSPTKTNTEDKTIENTEVNTESNTEVNTESNTEVNTEINTEVNIEKMQEDQEVQEVSKVSEVPEVPEVLEVSDDSDNNDENDENEQNTVPPTEEKETAKDENPTSQKDPLALCSIKVEPQDDEDTDGTIEVESANGSELLSSPLAISEKEDTIMEADSTQKSSAAGSSPKKKLRRGPHTHFRGTRVFKQKCTHCQIFLHSKYSFLKHMKRFHSKENGGENSALMSPNDIEVEEEMVEDLEDELVTMEKDSPLTEVQQEIISQLKTFCCYTCEQTFNDRRSTLSHIRQHLPDLRPYTCIACLTEFSDRSMYQSHCGASFECAMKIALVVPKHGSERYFTCNMCMRPLQNRKELLSHLLKHSDKQYEEMISPARTPPKLKPMAPLPSTTRNDSNDNKARKAARGPYKNGDPAHNHACDLCGMIYRYRPNMFKHREYCERLIPERRTMYKCAHCNMTFLQFKKFHSHTTVQHKKKEFTCIVCDSKFRSPSDFLTHHEKHRASPGGSSQSNNVQNVTQNQAKSKIVDHKYSCPLCNQRFTTKTELTEHRNLHLKVKIYSCVICRSMFSSSGALEIHMKDHGIEDPNERNANISCVEYGSLEEDVRIENDLMNATAVSDPGPQVHECCECGKVLNTYANLRRHAKIAHRNTKIYDCVECSKMFTRTDLYDYHMQTKHNVISKNMIQCSQCPKSFVFQSNFTYHFRTAHLEKSQNGYACDICGKVFVEEASLKIHKGWHNRANSRLSTRLILGNQKSPSDAPHDASSNVELGENSERPARARKSFPNAPLQSPLKSLGNFQCQVCNDKFNDVTELRNHLWDVHCARNKQEKNFSNDELQCELCTNVFPDRKTLESHMQWHKANPILSDIRKVFNCEICGKSYSSKKVLWKHKRLHKATAVASLKFQSLARKPMASQFLCTFCRKVFASSQSLQRHKLSFHSDPLQRAQQQLYNSNRRFLPEDDSSFEPRLKRPKLDMSNDNLPSKLPPFAMNFAGDKKKVMCDVCNKGFSSMSALYKHKQSAHKDQTEKDPRVPECIPMSTRDGKLSCNVCFKKFPRLSNLRQHFTIKHKKTASPAKSSSNSAPNNGGLSFSIERPDRPEQRPKEQEPMINNVLYSCKLCKQCHVFSRDNIISHITKVHNAVYQIDSKMFHKETDLSAYVVHDAIGATCPRCNVKYPNNKALKIHYIKFHEDAD